MDNAIYRQGMNRNMTNPIQRGGANNSATKVQLDNGLGGLRGNNSNTTDQSSDSNSFLNNWRGLDVNKLKDAINSAIKNTTEKSGPADAPKKSSGDDSGDEEVVEFSYKPGDAFGQKIIDLGLATDNGLWGDDGDVAYYTKQLRDQGALDSYGNIILGKNWKLKKRK